MNVDEIDSGSKTATVTVSSDPQTKTLSVGEEWRVNLDGDGDYDLLVRLVDVTFSRAEVFVQEIDEKLPTEEVDDRDFSEETAGVIDGAVGVNWVSIAGGILLVLVLFVLAFWMGLRYLGKK
ncbi:hypothetical protein HOA55_05220 [archaeon]|nr:hypothetical protein [archaeon]MBT3577722.1 hypothetical protein [archaeon]MBT6820729.1 hypothetical protein [archaeon]MBT6955899.1 hypothetical protein [archaeon]MBT7025869.1 hypothetical protein [archaeon]